MIVKKYNEINEDKVSMEGAKGAHIRWLVVEDDGAENFAMRRFRIEKDGYTPFHKHPHEHETYILEGEGVMVTEDGEKHISKGSFVFVKPYEKHQFKNTGDSELVFLCMIPLVNKEC